IVVADPPVNAGGSQCSVVEAATGRVDLPTRPAVSTPAFVEIRVRLGSIATRWHAPLCPPYGLRYGSVSTILERAPLCPKMGVVAMLEPPSLRRYSALMFSRLIRSPQL